MKVLFPLCCADILIYFDILSKLLVPTPIKASDIT